MESSHWPLESSFSQNLFLKESFKVCNILVEVKIYNPQNTTSYLNNDFIFYSNFVFGNNHLGDF